VTTTTTQGAAGQAGKLATGADIKTAKAGARLRFGGGLYLLVGKGGAKSWQVHYHVAGKHQATIIGRWPDLGIVEARTKRDDIARTVRDGGDPAQDRQEARAVRRDGDAATVRVIGAAWIETAQEARGWSPPYARMVAQRMTKHVYPVIGDRAIGRVGAVEVEAVVLSLVRAKLRAQAVHVRQHMQLMFDYAVRRDLLAVNPVRKIAEDLPKRIRGDAREVSRAHVETIEEARRVLAAVEASSAGPFVKLAHRLIALTAVRKLEGIGARWSEISDGAEGMTWKIPGERMKGRRGQKRDHVIPLSLQAADVFRAARDLQAAAGIVSDFVFPGQNKRDSMSAAVLNDVMERALPGVGLAGRHVVHGWRATFSTLCNEADPGAYRVIDVMLAHKAFGEVEARYNKATFIAERRKLASAWADQVLAGAPSASALVGLVEADMTNVVEMRRAA
jgi:integrase